jgi:hypothetical protein
MLTVVGGYYCGIFTQRKFAEPAKQPLLANGSEKHSFLGNGLERNNGTTSVARQQIHDTRQLNGFNWRSNRGTVFSVSYNHGGLGQPVSCRNPQLKVRLWREEFMCDYLECVIQWVCCSYCVNIRCQETNGEDTADWKVLSYAVVICKVWKLARVL